MPPVAANLEAHHEGLFGQGCKMDPPLHIDQQRLQIEVLIRRVTRQPALSPCAKGAYHDRQLLARFGDGVFRAVGTVGSGDRPGQDKGLEPFGKDSAGHTGNAPADVVEAAGTTQDFPYNQESPTPAQQFVGTRH